MRITQLFHFYFYTVTVAFNIYIFLLTQSQDKKLLYSSLIVSTQPVEWNTC